MQSKVTGCYSVIFLIHATNMFQHYSGIGSFTLLALNHDEISENKKYTF